MTHEEVFREPREWCAARSRRAGSIVSRKLFYVFTCEFCFSHWVTLFFLLITRFKLLLDDWRGYLIGGFALVWIANVYMSLFGRLRLEIREERAEVAVREAEQKEAVQSIDASSVAVGPNQRRIFPSSRSRA